MNLARLQSFIAPLATPAAPALLLANELYRIMLLVDIPAWLSLIAAGVAIVGVEFSGALMCYNAIRAWNRRSWGAMWLAIGGAMIYAVIVWAGIATMEQQRGRVFGVMVLLTLVAYLAYAIYAAFDTADREADKAARASVIAAKAEAELVAEQRRLTNAQTRQLKAGVSNSSTGQLTASSIQSGQPGQRPIIAITPAGQSIIDYLDANGDGWSLREIAAACNNVSPMTAAKWLGYWRENKRGE
jgi:4-amino-4-deoxy-L-arabinose transferase-like glycosyltransferase